MFAEDREYVERVLSGETEIFENLVRKYNSLGGGIAYGVLGDFQLAEDVVQDAFIRAYKSLGTLRHPERFQVWFTGIVKKRAIDVLRQLRSPTRRTVSLDRPAGAGDDSELGDLLAADDASVVESFLRAVGRRKVLAAVSELSETDRTVIVLKHMEGLSYKEIATLTGTSVSSVESRLFRARKTLRRKLQQLLELDSRES